MDTIVHGLGIEPGATTEDYRFSLERVACFGACALGPVIVIDNIVHGRMTTAEAKRLMAEYQAKQ